MPVRPRCAATRGTLLPQSWNGFSLGERLATPGMADRLVGPDSSIRICGCLLDCCFYGSKLQNRSVNCRLTRWEPGYQFAHRRATTRCAVRASTEIAVPRPAPRGSGGESWKGSQGSCGSRERGRQDADPCSILALARSPVGDRQLCRSGAYGLLLWEPNGRDEL